MNDDRPADHPIDEHIPRDPDRGDEIGSGAETVFEGSGADLVGAGGDEPVAADVARPPDPRCSFCGYVLSGLSVNQNCPECGKPIWDSNSQLPTSGFAITSMVLGIVSVVSCVLYGLPSLVLGPLALVFSHLGKNQLRDGVRAGATRGFCIAGFWTGIGGITLGAVYVGFFVVIILSL
ncbi:MAG: DUF4190 domain-containing protein [bacterium]|nr:DUF4190 domain-containing protein [bacterium]